MLLIHRDSSVVLGPLLFIGKPILEAGPHIKSTVFTVADVCLKVQFESCNVATEKHIAVLL